VSESGWWALALSEAVTADKPIPVRCGELELALFRNAEGVACALEDRCPHRRAPLSLGRINGGALQCGYHGWTFDGTTGACKAIPNLHADERVPPRYAAQAYPVAEANGFVHVWLGAEAPGPVLPTSLYIAAADDITGSAVVGLAHDEYMGVMLDGPEHLLGFREVIITDFYFGEPRRVGDHLRLDHGAVWRGRVLGPQFVTDHPLVVRTHVPVAGGGGLIELMNADEEPLITVFIGTAPNKRGATSLFWRGRTHARLAECAPFRWKVSGLRGRPAFEVFTPPDGAAVATLPPGPSQNLAAARRAVETPQLATT
jgi:hypothetical protein